MLASIRMLTLEVVEGDQILKVNFTGLLDIKSVKKREESRINPRFGVLTTGSTVVVTFTKVNDVIYQKIQRRMVLWGLWFRVLISTSLL